jgi:hypothetical protein
LRKTAREVFGAGSSVKISLAAVEEARGLELIRLTEQIRSLSNNEQLLTACDDRPDRPRFGGIFHL